MSLFKRDKLLDLPLPENYSLITYVWIDGTEENVRGKTRVMEFIPQSLNDVPEWNFDGSSTEQCDSSINSDILIKPVALYRDPFQSGATFLVMCDTFSSDGNPHKTNYRNKLTKVESETVEFEPWFAIEQEYAFFVSASCLLGWPKKGFLDPQGPYYCGVGAETTFGRTIVEKHLRACLFAGVKIAGTNAEGLPAQWEYQIGPASATKMADDTWISRYIMKRIGEFEGVTISFHPKPVQGNWNGSGAHMNFSTKQMRAKDGMSEILTAIEKLKINHKKHITNYDPTGGEVNKLRLTGKNETGSIEKFTWGVANRLSSVRIPRQVANDNCGYLEDRRPAANCDPYRVALCLLETICLNES